MAAGPAVSDVSAGLVGLRLRIAEAAVPVREDAPSGGSPGRASSTGRTAVGSRWARSHAAGPSSRPTVLVNDVPRLVSSCSDCSSNSQLAVESEHLGIVVLGHIPIGADKHMISIWLPQGYTQ